MPSVDPGLGYADRMISLSYRGHRFSASIIQHAIWLYFRFSLS
jgi:transposase-like protein